VAQAMDNAVRDVPGVSGSVLTKVVDPPWTVDCISPEGRKAMGL
jgi:metal-sulfur cluster biosynthetic enzyme